MFANSSPRSAFDSSSDEGAIWPAPPVPAMRQLKLPEATVCEYVLPSCDCRAEGSANVVTGIWNSFWVAPLLYDAMTKPFLSMVTPVCKPTAAPSWLVKFLLNDAANCVRPSVLPVPMTPAIPRLNATLLAFAPFAQLTEMDAAAAGAPL